MTAPNGGGAFPPPRSPRQFLSLFAGIGGFDLGLEWAGWECIGQIEVDPYARRVLERHWPHVRRRGDIRLVHDDLAREWWGGVEAIVGGFPCQPVSHAGKQLRQADRRWIWPEMCRLVRALRPRYVIVENVRGLLKGGLDAVLGDLAASGYDAEWSSFPACAVGAPHPRDRVFIVAYPHGLHGIEGVGPFIQRAAARFNQHDGQSASRDQGPWVEAPPSLGPLADGVSRRAPLKALGNAVVPHIPMLLAQAIDAAEAMC